MEYRTEDLTKEETVYIGEKIDEIVPRETDADEEEFVLKVEDETGTMIGGCVATAYEYHWSRMFLNELWVDERCRHHGIGSMILREVERIAKEKGCRVVTLGTTSYMARPFYEKHGYTVFTTVKTPDGYISYSLVKYLDADTPCYVPTDNSGTRFKLSFGNDGDAEVIDKGLDTYNRAYVHKSETVDFCRKLTDRDGRFTAGVIANAEKGDCGFVNALFVEEPLRHKGLGTYLLREAERFAKENGAVMVFTSAGDWNVGFFKKNGYQIRGKLRDVPKGHDCYELYKMI